MGLLLNRYDTPAIRWRRIGRMVSGWQCKVEGCSCVVWQDERPDGVCPECGSKPLKGFVPDDYAEKPERCDQPSERSFLEGGFFDDGWR